MKIFFFVILLMLLSPISQTAFSMGKDTFIIGEPVLDKNLPSGSGMLVMQPHIYVVGDDSPYLFQLNKKFKTDVKYPLQHVPFKFSGRLNKNVKPDFESMTRIHWQGRDWILIMGSGSKKHTRERAILVSPDARVRLHYSLAQLYRSLYQISGMSSGQKINIEAVATTAKQVLIFNRGNSGKNLIFTVSQAQLMDFLSGESKTLTSLKVFHVKLPIYQGVQSTFSGADYWLETDSIIYSASLEATDNAIKDGSVLGSYLGVLPVSSLSQPDDTLDLSRNAYLLRRGGKVLITKVESVALAETSLDSVKGYLVSDNDKGASEFFKFNIIHNKAQSKTAIPATSL